MRWFGQRRSGDCCNLACTGGNCGSAADEVEEADETDTEEENRGILLQAGGNLVHGKDGRSRKKYGAPVLLVSPAGACLVPSFFPPYLFLCLPSFPWTLFPHLIRLARSLPGFPRSPRISFFFRRSAHSEIAERHCGRSLKIPFLTFAAAINSGHPHFSRLAPRVLRPPRRGDRIKLTIGSKTPTARFAMTSPRCVERGFGPGERETVFRHGRVHHNLGSSPRGFA
jgi:hypothetical protein